MQCVCGERFSDTRKLHKHRQLCTQLRDAIIQDLRHVSRRIGRVPSVTEYGNLKGKLIPSKSFIQQYFSSWNNLLDLAGLPVTRRCGPMGYDMTDRQPVMTKMRYYWEAEREIEGR
jgi:hypothetical protein